MENLIEVELYKIIYKQYLYFLKKLPHYFKKIDGECGGCGAWAIGLYNYFSNLGYNVQIKELNKGIHYWVEVENCCSMDWKYFTKNCQCPNYYFFLNNKQHVKTINILKSKKIISKRVIFKKKYLNEFEQIGKEISLIYLKSQ